MNTKTKRVLSICYDSFFVFISIYLANVLRLKTFDIHFDVYYLICILLTICATVFVFMRLGMYRAVLRYITIPALGNIFISVLLSSVVFTLSCLFFGVFLPRSVPVIYGMLAILLLGAPRVLIKMSYFYFYRKKKPNVIVYGAGSTGRHLVYSLLNGTEYHPVAIIDDDEQKQGQIISGLRIYGSQDFDRLLTLYDPEKILFAINNISKGQRLRIFERLSNWPVEVLSVPSLDDIALGRNREEVRELYVADLLGRTAVDPDPQLMKRNIEGKNILVTGAGGSIGSELCRQIVRQRPKKVVLFELNEFNLYAIDQELKQMKERLQIEVTIVFTLGNVQNKRRMLNLMTQHQIDTVYHAAAYKHVPIVEENIINGIENNVFGTLAVAEAAIEAKVKHFTLISTDKAVRPTNIMGSTKRLAELVLQALADEQNDTIFTMVRFGNVLDSSGSVVPLFKKQIRQGGPVTVTHPEIIRYFMLIPEAAQLVIQAGAIAQSGQVFVLDMGKPVKILALAERMIKLMGLTYYCSEPEVDLPQEGDIEIRFTGLRPGEKLYEELLIGNNVLGTVHPKIMTAMEKKLSWFEMKQLLDELSLACHASETEKVVQIISNRNSLVDYVKYN